jgi:hypothetical protein
MARKAGIYPWGKPDYAQSISTYGGLHFGTEFGWHKEVKPSPRGRKYGWQSNFILCLSLGRELLEITKDFFGHPHGAFKHALACGHALVSEAERRNAIMTVLAGPRAWQFDYDNYWMEDMSKKTLGQRFKIEFYDQMGKKHPFKGGKHGRHGGEVGPDYLLIDPTIDSWHTHISDYSFPEQLKDITDGRFSSEEAANMCPPLFVNTQNYAEVRRMFLKMPNFGHGEFRSCDNIADIPVSMFSYLRLLWNDLSKTERSTIIWVGNAKYHNLINVSWKVFQDLRSRADIWFFDIGDRDKEEYFFGERALSMNACRKNSEGDDTNVPLMISGGKRLFNYVYVDDVENLTKIVLAAMRKV